MEDVLVTRLIEAYEPSSHIAGLNVVTSDGRNTNPNPVDTGSYNIRIKR
jgi:flagellar hook assembly protein FlgD